MFVRRVTCNVPHKMFDQQNQRTLFWVVWELYKGRRLADTLWSDIFLVHMLFLFDFFFLGDNKSKTFFREKEWNLFCYKCINSVLYNQGTPLTAERKPQFSSPACFLNAKGSCELRTHWHHSIPRTAAEFFSFHFLFHWHLRERSSQPICPEIFAFWIENEFTTMQFAANLHTVGAVGCQLHSCMRLHHKARESRNIILTCLISQKSQASTVCEWEAQVMHHQSDKIMKNAATGCRVAVDACKRVTANTKVQGGLHACNLQQDGVEAMSLSLFVDPFLQRSTLPQRCRLEKANIEIFQHISLSLSLSLSFPTYTWCSACRVVGTIPTDFIQQEFSSCWVRIRLEKSCVKCLLKSGNLIP